MSKAVFFQTLERGVTAHQAGRLDDALQAYRAALEIRPNDPEASSLCGLALLHSGKGEEALPLLQQAVEREPGQNGFRLNLAEGLAQTGNPERAMVELGLIVATEPTNLVALGRFYALECDALVAAGRLGPDPAISRNMDAESWDGKVELLSQFIARLPEREEKCGARVAGVQAA